jgi:hypothetical protein
MAEKRMKHAGKLLDYKGKLVHIDDFLVELIQLLWAKGIDTTMCCEDNVPKNYCWVQFPDSSNLEKFLDTQGDSTSKINNKRWFIRAHINFTAELGHVVRRFSLRFPRSDRDEIVAKLESS